ncbi:MAG: DUF2849 domain-containing protein [Chitinophagales bacterium]|nr:DUF2849 domain-containing protein [Hyphomicrobiales bacterium]
MSKKNAPKILTANQLLGGYSVFWAGSAWRADLEGASVASTPEAAAALMEKGQASEQANEVVGVYLVDVELDSNANPYPTHYREKMRVRARPSFWPDAADPSGVTPFKAFIITERKAA